MSQWMRARETRVLLRRESLWSYEVPESVAEIPVLSTSRATLVRALSVVYTTHDTIPAFEDSVMPVLGALSTVRSHIMVAFLLRAPHFEAARLRPIIQRCADSSVATLVELGGEWPEPALEFLVDTRPSYLRVGPEYVRAVAAFPEGFRRLVRLAEFAREHQVPLVARGVDNAEDLTTLRLAGISLLHQAESGPPDTDVLVGLVEGDDSSSGPIVLPFPLRPRSM